MINPGAWFPHRIWYSAGRGTPRSRPCPGSPLHAAPSQHPPLRRCHPRPACPRSPDPLLPTQPAHPLHRHCPSPPCPSSAMPDRMLALLPLCFVSAWASKCMGSLQKQAGSHSIKMVFQTYGWLVWGRAHTACSRPCQCCRSSSTSSWSC